MIVTQIITIRTTSATRVIRLKFARSRSLEIIKYLDIVGILPGAYLLYALFIMPTFLLKAFVPGVFCDNVVLFVVFVNFVFFSISIN
jgi:hypothetical protein